VNRKRAAIFAGIIVAVAASGAAFLRQVALPQTTEGLGKAIPALLQATLAQAGRLTQPQRVLPKSVIVLDHRSIGELTLRFGVRQDQGTSVTPTSGSRATGLLRAFETPDSSLILNGRLWNAAIARKIRADSSWVAVFSQEDVRRPIIVRIVHREELSAAAVAGFLWLPADSITLTLYHGGA